MKKTIPQPSVEVILKKLARGEFHVLWEQENKQTNPPNTKTKPIQFDWGPNEFPCCIWGWEIHNEGKKPNGCPFVTSAVYLGDSPQFSKENRLRVFTFHIPPIPIKTKVFLKSLRYNEIRSAMGDFVPFCFVDFAHEQKNQSSNKPPLPFQNPKSETLPDRVEQLQLDAPTVKFLMTLTAELTKNEERAVCTGTFEAIYFRLKAFYLSQTGKDPIFVKTSTKPL